MIVIVDERQLVKEGYQSRFDREGVASAGFGSSEFGKWMTGAADKDPKASPPGSLADAKDRERQLLTRSIDLLSVAHKQGIESLEAVEAIHFLNRVWTSIIENLASSHNQLPMDLRANLLSIGLWLLREAEEVRQGRSDNFEGLIEVSQIIRDGIQ